LVNEERPIIRSDGAFVRDYIYVKDVACAYMRLAEYLTRLEVLGQPFNFSTEEPKSVLEIVAALRALMNCTHIEPEIVNTAVGEIRSQQLSTVNARTILEWKPSYSLETGLKETIVWYKDFLS
jgi:CDP-glucose 4,6-dehydratase